MRRGQTEISERRLSYVEGTAFSVSDRRDFGLGLRHYR